MSQIAIVGPGAIGGTVAAWLQEAGRSVTICARSPFTRLLVETPDGDLVSTPTILLSPEAAIPVDWILVATKAYDVPAAAVWLPGLSNENTKVAVLQNGVEHVERLLPFVRRDAIVPVVVDVPAERVGPGHFRQRRRGQMTVQAGPDGEAFRALFQNAPVDLALVADFHTAAWRKLAINCAGAVAALTLKPASVVHNPSAATLMRALVRECIAVGRATGARLDDALVEQVLDGYRNGPADGINSLHADRMAGRPMEIEARHGVIVRLGQAHGIATPANAMVTLLLEACR